MKTTSEILVITKLLSSKETSFISYLLGFNIDDSIERAMGQRKLREFLLTYLFLRREVIPLGTPDRTTLELVISKIVHCNSN
jgi:hypothetical protein